MPMAAAYNNEVNVKQWYPRMPGRSSVAMEATTPMIRKTTPKVAGGSDNKDVQASQSVGMMGEPIRWWVALAILLMVLMYSAQRFDGNGNYGNLKLTAYNILSITLSAIIGITLFKVFFTKFPVPGLTLLIQAV